VLGGAVSTLMYAGQAWTARSRRDRIGNGLMAAGSAATTAGMVTAGGSLLALGTGTAVVPPVGLCLIGAGATLCVAGYLVEHPRWRNSAVRVGGRVLDVAWQAQTAPVRVAAGVAGKIADGARSVIGSIPTPW
jgi:hypothetical protein